MARTKLVDGVRINLTAEEEAERDSQEAQFVVDQAAYEADAIARKEKLDSVKSKLETLGLTTEEVKEAFGI
tara:strand:- start:99 stop:311 length:213 start_codon:yes stop_codon:yes gene_type:complete